MICVEEAGDASNLQVLSICKQYDPHFKRTVLVRNKLDKYYNDLTRDNVNDWLQGFGPRLWMTAAKMRGRRSSLSARSSAGNLLSPDDDSLMRECEERLMNHLKPMQPRGCNDTA